MPKRTPYAQSVLSRLGWTVLRFWNDDVLRDIDNVCQHIVIAAGLAAPESTAFQLAPESTSPQINAATREVAP